MTDLILYTTEDGKTRLELHLAEGTIWLSQLEIAQLFQTSKQNISKHIKAIFDDQELTYEATVNQKLTVQIEGEREVQRELTLYNLDVILAVGYRVRSVRGVQFRRYASTVLKEYLEKGFAMDDERLKGLGGGDYWKELLDRIRDIRSSEKALYRQVLDLYATSQDYDPKSEATLVFFKMVQNKLHYATSLQTAPELVFNRADSSKDFMGLTTFAGALPTLQEAKIAKNYLTEEELFRLNRLVSAFFDLAELRAQERRPMFMQDWVDELDKFSGSYGKGILQGSGSISREQANAKATQEYRAYQARTLSPVEQAYLKSIKDLEKLACKQIE
ncbi:MAG: virulence RhuM family protein [Desulfovibrionales bacterium]|nr:virulence RhuM family protein [Desulfovibrionales bacterium]